MFGKGLRWTKNVGWFTRLIASRLKNRAISFFLSTLHSRKLNSPDQKGQRIAFFCGWAYILGNNSQDHEMATENEGL